jgi:hypothetical protein
MSRRPQLTSAWRLRTTELAGMGATGFDSYDYTGAAFTQSRQDFEETTKHLGSLNMIFWSCICLYIDDPTQ